MAIKNEMGIASITTKASRMPKNNKAIKPTITNPCVKLSKKPFTRTLTLSAC